MNFSKAAWSAANPFATKFSKNLLDLQHPTPWRVCEENLGAILDANGDPVAVIDPDCLRSDEDTIELAIWIVTAINTCAGFEVDLVKVEH